MTEEFKARVKAAYGRAFSCGVGSHDGHLEDSFGNLLNPQDQVYADRCTLAVAWKMDKDEAMDAGYAAGVENTEARASRRIGELEKEVELLRGAMLVNEPAAALYEIRKELEDLKAGKCRCWQENGATEKSHGMYCPEAATLLDKARCEHGKKVRAGVVAHLAKVFEFCGQCVPDQGICEYHLELSEVINGETK